MKISNHNTTSKCDFRCDFSSSIPNPFPSSIEAAHHICEEARILLSNLRDGPPSVAHGELTQDLRDLRLFVKSRFLVNSTCNHFVKPNDFQNNGICLFQPFDSHAEESNQINNSLNGQNDEIEKKIVTDNSETKYMQDELGYLNVFKSSHGKIKQRKCYQLSRAQIQAKGPANLGPYAAPFLSVIISPRAAGSYTLAALRSLQRLLERGSLDISCGDKASDDSGTLKEHRFSVGLETLAKGILSCRFEQTDNGADEAVEMAIADLLSLIVDLDSLAVSVSSRLFFEGCNSKRVEKSPVKRAGFMSDMIILEIFNSVFVTRNSFVHSPALCYHFETVLMGMAKAKFSQDISCDNEGARSILEFLVRQLLYTPIAHGAVTTVSSPQGRTRLSSRVFPDKIKRVSDVTLSEGGAEAHALHEETRILCLRLIQVCLRTGWNNSMLEQSFPVKNDENKNISLLKRDRHEQENRIKNKNYLALLKIIQDDLCLSLLMIGQGIWGYQDPSNNLEPGIISIDLLSEVCATLSTLWNLRYLRKVLTSQFEAFFTGFYQRSLSLLRKLPIPSDIKIFHANEIFDAEMEIILESLVDILSLNDNKNCGSGDGGTLKELFVTYDCNISRSDVATGLITELCRCCGGRVQEDDKIPLFSTNEANLNSAMRSKELSADLFTDENQRLKLERSLLTLPREIDTIEWNDMIRHVPGQLRELCAEAILSSMQCVFLNEGYPLHGIPVKNMKKNLNEITSNGIFVINKNMREDDEKKGTEDYNSLRRIIQTKKLMRNAVKLFNKKVSDGIQFMVSNGLLQSPVMPKDVSRFLRDGIVLGLDKKVIGEYLGQAGKAPVASKSPPNWERDWFHKETLQAYCSSFRFFDLSLIECLRMFLAAFRLPGEAQQIDRILQTFAETSGRLCVESFGGRLGYFSSNEKKATDTAYLLSFSIIMLNTDLHNSNIRDNCKMTLGDFIKNNNDYGRDITEVGKELPDEYLKELYEGIRDDQIRTEGEGADGVMTFDRWKDVVKNDVNVTDKETPVDVDLGINADCICNRNEVKELIVENLWLPIIYAIGNGFWGMSTSGKLLELNHTFYNKGKSSMFSTQGFRLGMDLSVEMMRGLKNIHCTFIFQEFFVRICFYTGLMGSNSSNTTERTTSFIDSVERQSALIIVLKMAKENGDIIGWLGWKCIWAILFELRDIKILSQASSKSLIMESDDDLLRPEYRKKWNMELLRQCKTMSNGSVLSYINDKPNNNIFGAMGRALFRSDDKIDVFTNSDVEHHVHIRNIYMAHGKEQMILWDNCASSDEEVKDKCGKKSQDVSCSTIHGYETNLSGLKSIGVAFERQIIEEDNIKNQPGPPITGLEKYDDTRIYQLSKRARVRNRLSRFCDFSGILSESRFLSMNGIENLLQALVDIINQSSSKSSMNNYTSLFKEIWNKCRIIISPASEALAEVLLCEIALKNRDRIALCWNKVLWKHYHDRLSSSYLQISPSELTSQNFSSSSLLMVGMEKCVTSLLRICFHTVNRNDVTDKILSSLKLLYPPSGMNSSNILIHRLDRHLGEGLWRICRNIDGVSQIGTDGWEGLLGLVQYCASCGQTAVMKAGERSGALPEDDPSLQAFRCIHHMLHSAELKNIVPFRVNECIRALVISGERQKCHKLIIAGLDLLWLLHMRFQSLISNFSLNDKVTPKLIENYSKSFIEENFWVKYWLPVLEGIAMASDSIYTNVRQHSISLLTDAVIDRQGEHIPTEQLCLILSRICVPVSGHRISYLIQDEVDTGFQSEETMIEISLCINLLFNPFLHHLKKIFTEKKEFTGIWRSILVVSSQLLGNEVNGHINFNATQKQSDNNSMTTRNLTAEKLRNAIMILISNQILEKNMAKHSPGNTNGQKDITSLTWNALENITFCREIIEELTH